MVPYRRVWRGLVVVALLAASPAHCGSYEPGLARLGGEATASGRQSIVTGNNTITQAADEFRTGWYPDQPGLDPGIVASGGFGRAFQTTLTLTPKEQVYAQPLVSSDGSHVFIATMANDLYVLDAKTGAITASKALGKPWNESDVACGDLMPTIGVVSTPVIDVASNTAYLNSKSYDATGAAAWYLHAVDATTLEERPGFPVTIAGTADNNQGIVFAPKYQNQRTGLLLLNGVVYAGFSAHCDVGTYHGWIIGVSTAGQIVARFATEAGPMSNGGAGIWHSGGGLVSDGPGRILFVTGNGRSPAPTGAVPEDMPTVGLGESVVRVDVQPGGGVKPGQWFAPSNAGMLGDEDMSSGGPVALPSPMFGTPATPNLLVIGGKHGIVFTLDRDHLGGFLEGAGGTDNAVGSIQVGGGMWSKPAVWPGDGGWIYVDSSGGVGIQALKYSLNGQGVPTFAIVGKTTDTFGSFAGSPIVTSNGTNAGSALVWVTHDSGQLRAYNAVPDANGVLNMIFSDNFGPHVKMQSAGVGAGTIFVGTNDGHVTGYAARATVISGPPVDFGTVIVGSTKTAAVTLTATQATTVTALTSSDPTAFAVGASTPALPAKLAANQSMTVQVTFSPPKPSGYTAALNVTSSAGAGGAPLKGSGQADGPYLTASPTSIAFGTVAAGTSNPASIVLANQGSKPLTFASFAPPMAPYSATGLPAAGQTLAPGATVTTTVVFAPTANGVYMSSLGVQSDGGNLTIAVTGSAAPMPKMVISPLNLDFGAVPPGTTKTMSFTIANTGGSNLTIVKSKPPSQGIFTATTSLPEGSVVAPGASLTETVAASAMGSGDFTDAWIITGNDRPTPQTVTFSIGDAVGAGGAAGGPPGTWRSSQSGCSTAATGRTPPALPVGMGLAVVAFSWARRRRRRPAGFLAPLVALLPSACGSPRASSAASADAASSGGDSGAWGVDASAVDASGDTADGGAVGTGCPGTQTICWGFEEGVTTPPGWSIGRTDYGAVVLASDAGTHAGPALVVDQTRPHWGRYSLHARSFAGGAPATQGGPKATIVYRLPAQFGSVLWGRAFVFTAPAAPDSHAGVFNARYPRPGSTATAMSALDWYEVASYTKEYMTVWHPPEPPGYPEDVQVSGTPVVLDRFACLEWLFDGSLGDAGEASAPRMWVDGTELSWPDSFTYPDGSAPSPREAVGSFLELETGIYLYQGLATVTDWWIDDLAVGPRRIGCN